jgi:hypothetical protein
MRFFSVNEYAIRETLVSLFSKIRTRASSQPESDWLLTRLFYHPVATWQPVMHLAMQQPT